MAQRRPERGNGGKATIKIRPPAPAVAARGGARDVEEGKRTAGCTWGWAGGMFDTSQTLFTGLAFVPGGPRAGRHPDYRGDPRPPYAISPVGIGLRRWRPGGRFPGRADFFPFPRRSLVLFLHGSWAGPTPPRSIGPPPTRTRFVAAHGGMRAP